MDNKNNYTVNKIYLTGKIHLIAGYVDKYLIAQIQKTTQLCQFFSHPQKSLMFFWVI